MARKLERQLPVRTGVLQYVRGIDGNLHSVNVPLDAEPTEGSENLIKSGAVYSAIANIETDSDTKVNAPLDSQGEVITGTEGQLLVADGEGGTNWTDTIGTSQIASGAVTNDKLDAGVFNIIAPEFTPSVNYNSGDVVIYGKQLYRFRQSHSGIWNASHVESVNVSQVAEGIADGTTYTLENRNGTISLIPASGAPSFIPMDAEPTQDSTYPVQSRGVYSALQGKMGKYVFDYRGGGAISDATYQDIIARLENSMVYVQTGSEDMSAITKVETISNNEKRLHLTFSNGIYPILHLVKSGDVWLASWDNVSYTDTTGMQTAIGNVTLKADNVTTEIDNKIISVRNQGISTDKIANGAVTSSKLATDSVTTAKIVNGSVTHAKLANNAVGTDNLAASSVTMAKIASGIIDADPTSGSPNLVSSGGVYTAIQQAISTGSGLTFVEDN